MAIDKAIAHGPKEAQSAGCTTAGLHLSGQVRLLEHHEWGSQNSGGSEVPGRAGAAESRAGGTRSSREMGVQTEEPESAHWKMGEVTGIHTEEAGGTRPRRVLGILEAGGIHWKTGEAMGIHWTTEEAMGIQVWGSFEAGSQ